MASRNLPSCCQDFEIAIICALSVEFDPVSFSFEQFWDEDSDPFRRASGDTNQYTMGRVAEHDVVLVLLPQMGKPLPRATDYLQINYP
jgi:hypothetical protein